MNIGNERRTVIKSRILPFFIVIFLATTSVLSIGKAADSSTEATNKFGNIKQTTMRIRITVNGKVLSADLLANATAIEFAAMLPLTLELTDYNRTEKIAQISKSLVTADAPKGFTPAAGDIAYYAPWGNLAIFHKGFGYSKGLIKLGHIQGDLSILKPAVPQKALIEPE